MVTKIPFWEEQWQQCGALRVSFSHYILYNKFPNRVDTLTATACIFFLLPLPTSKDYINQEDLVEW
jgi:hypothetical protein